MGRLEGSSFESPTLEPCFSHLARLADPPVAGRRVPTAGSVDLHGLPSCFRLPFGVTWLDIFTLRKQVSRQGTHTGHCARP